MSWLLNALTGRLWFQMPSGGLHSPDADSILGCMDTRRNGNGRRGTWRRLVLVGVTAAVLGGGGSIMPILLEMRRQVKSGEVFWVDLDGSGAGRYCRWYDDLPLQEDGGWWSDAGPLWVDVSLWEEAFSRTSLRQVCAGLALGSLAGWLLAAGLCWVAGRWRRRRAARA
jgi:hypothetical protein